jgi:hypothetical protein
MSRLFLEDNISIDSDVEIERRHNFIERMQRKLESKQSVLGSRF